MKKLFFFTQGNDRIGHGHLMRCRSLAERVSEAFDCRFVLVQSPAELRAQLFAGFASLGFASYSEALTYLAGQASPHDLVIIDSYEVTARAVQQLREQGLNTLAINDLPEQALPADWLLNHAPGLRPEDFQLSSPTRLLLGARYLLLRKPFFEISDSPTPPRQDRMFVCFGGSDPEGLSLKVIRYLRESGMSLPLEILTNSPQTRDRIRAFQQEHQIEGIQLHSRLDAEAIIALIQSCSLAVLPGSTIALEAMCVGIPLLTGYYVENQMRMAHNFGKLGLALNVGDFRKMTASAFVDSLKKIPREDQVARQRQLFRQDQQNILLTTLQHITHEHHKRRPEV
jgi:UDP-2,4-diacetamido-2,4,6-trideoxy-beta-L-altropyranose hydrolase